MSATTSSRLLELLALLQARGVWRGEELADRLEVSVRTVRRDVRRLRDLGYPVSSVPGPAGSYALKAGTAMPPLLLDEDEAVAIAVGLRTETTAAVEGTEETSLRALVKLEQVLPAHLRRRVSALAGAISSPQLGGPTVDAHRLAALAAACRDAEPVRFGYLARDGARTRREVEPHALVNRGRRWYLVAWDRGREDWRSFRVDRIASPVSGGRRFEPRTLPGADAAAFVDLGIAQAPSRYEARVLVAAPVAEMERRSPAHWGRFVPVDEERCEFRARDDDLGWLAIRVAMLPAEFEVLGPPELAARVRELGRRLLRAAPG